MKKVLIDFTALSIAAKIAFYRNVISKLTNNSSFPNPDKNLGELKTLVDKLEADYINAKDGSRTAVATMHKSEDAADAAFRIVASYVDRTSAGDESMILSAGFDPSRDRSPVVKPDLSVTDGTVSGTVRLAAKAVEDAGAYIWQMAKASAPEDWSIIGHSTRVVFEIANLEPASKYYFRVAAITTSGVTDFTSPVQKIVI